MSNHLPRESDTSGLIGKLQRETSGHRTIIDKDFRISSYSIGKGASPTVTRIGVNEQRHTREEMVKRRMKIRKQKQIAMKTGMWWEGGYSSSSSDEDEYEGVASPQLSPLPDPEAPILRQGPHVSYSTMAIEARACTSTPTCEANSIAKDVFSTEECTASSVNEDLMTQEEEQKMPDIMFSTPMSRISGDCTLQQESESVMKHLDGMFDVIMTEIFSTPDTGARLKPVQQFVLEYASPVNLSASDSIGSQEVTGGAASSTNRYRRGGTLSRVASMQGDDTHGEEGRCCRDDVLKITSDSPLVKIREIEQNSALAKDEEYDLELGAVNSRRACATPYDAMAQDHKTQVLVPYQGLPPKPSILHIFGIKCRKLRRHLNQNYASMTSWKLVVDSIRQNGDRWNFWKPRVWVIAAVAYLVLIHLLLIGARLHQSSAR